MKVVRALLVRYGTWVLPLLVALPIAVRSVLEGHRRMLWADEILTWYQVMTSLPKVIAACADTISAAPPFYFVAAWAWMKVAPATAEGLRGLTTFAAVAAVFCTFGALRRVHGPLAAAAAIALGAWLHGDLLAQYSEARFHVMLVALLAAGLWCMVELLRRPKPPRWLLVLNAVVFACLAMTHYFAPLYGAPIVLATLVARLLRRRSIWPAVSSAVGASLFLLWLPVLPTHMDMGKPTTWVPVPGSNAASELLKDWTPDDWRTWVGVGVAFAVAGLVMRRKRKLRPRRWLARPELPLAIVAAGFLLVPFFAASWSLTHASVWLARYMLPTGLGITLVFAQLLAARVKLPLRAVQAVVFAYLLWKPGNAVVDRVKNMPFENRAQDLGLDAGPGGIVVEHIHAYLHLHFHAHKERYAFPVDPEVGVMLRGGGPLNHKIMGGLHRQFPDEFPFVIPTDEYLRSRTAFWVFPGNMLWWNVRLQNNPDWRLEPQPNGLLYVTRTSP